VLNYRVIVESAVTHYFVGTIWSTAKGSLPVRSHGRGTDQNQEDSPRAEWQGELMGKRTTEGGAVPKCCNAEENGAAERC
jgi:hypothetical protein